ncbi:MULTISPECIES: hypothetical protein [Marinovum]|uniref:hypothetical protein n=1 Tax=Marinovum TaxID=367771 RepID=UPI00237B793B|nr:hypothetical protein [Marinovum sp. PR37]MDD9742386.1 hypothetical protein [Marinovum sp. PR37]
MYYRRAPVSAYAALTYAFQRPNLILAMAEKSLREDESKQGGHPWVPHFDESIYKLAKINNLIRLSDEYGIDPKKLENLGVLNPTLAADILVFVDPLLLRKSKNVIFSKDAADAFDTYFEQVIKLVSVIKNEGDKPWKAAFKKLSFPEYGWTKLGYGGDRGAGSGEKTTKALLASAIEVIGIGVQDPDLFTALSVFEEGIGPDRISDMTCHIISGQIVKFNEVLANDLDVATKRYDIRLKNGGNISGTLIPNPYLTEDGPILLVPKDILRDLPLAADWADVSKAIKDNDDHREVLSYHIANLWQQKSKQQKSETKEYYTQDKEHFQEFLRLLRLAADAPYDFGTDPKGELFWRQLAHQLIELEPFEEWAPKKTGPDKLRECADTCIENVRFLFEKRRYASELYAKGKLRGEKAAQKLFFCVAYAFCKAQKIDIIPEAETDYGPVDFKFSTGFDERLLVEIKLSNNDLKKGYEKQLRLYAEAEETAAAIFLVFDLGGHDEKINDLLALKNKRRADGLFAPDIEIIDARLQRSASV